MPLNENKEYYSVHDSWIKAPKLTEDESLYLYSLEEIWRVKSGNVWVPYMLGEHQIMWHKYDVVLMKELAPIRIVKKSRCTSFTVSSIISILMSIGDYKNDVIPFVRLNQRKAEDMIKVAKDLIKRMKPIVYEIGEGERKEKIYWPFDPRAVDMSAVGSIKFRDKTGDIITEIRAFPANADSSESIRGIRTIGDSGILDETNFMRYFRALFTALRDSTMGKVHGKKIHQFSIGTTLKGETPFSEWLEEQEKKHLQRIMIFDWPVFDRAKFSVEIPFHENDDLVSIVPWHDKKELWETYQQDEHVFREEYMAEKVDSEEQFYPTSLILSRISDEEMIPLTEFHTLSDKYIHIWGGVDVATVHDYFVIKLYGETFEGKFENFYLEYASKVELDEMENRTKGVFSKVNEVMERDKWLCSVDANGIGIQITQNLKRAFPGNVRGISGGSMKDADGNSHRINEYGHTLLKRLMIDGNITFLNDELLIKHFAQWDYTFKAPSTGDGHGDITMSALYALLPRNLKRTQPIQIRTNTKLEDEMSDEEVENAKNSFMKMSMKDRMKFYKKRK